MGWDLPKFREIEGLPPTGGSSGFMLMAPAAFLLPRRRFISDVHVLKQLLFGNACQQYTNAFLVANRYGATRLEFSEKHQFFEGHRIGSLTLVWGKEQSARALKRWRCRPGIKGQFFDIRSLNLNPTPAEQAAIITRCLRRLLVPGLRKRHPEVGNDDLVLHFRAGEIFDTSREVHPHYGQPPLSYYMAAVERERPARVWLVFENRRNPVIDAAEARLREKGIEVRVQSGTLETDLHVLLSARRLVAGVGTFCREIACLSESIQRFYHFGPITRRLQHLGVEVIVARDLAGGYREQVMSGNWTCSPQQLDLMVNYPPESISFETRLPLQGE